MISNEAAHPNCMYLWMNHIISPEANAKVAAWFGEAPAQSKSCAEFKNLDPAYFGAPNHCELYNADNPEFWKRVYYWNTPLADCGDDRGDDVHGLQRLGLGLDRDQGVVARSWRPLA